MRRCKKINSDEKYYYKLGIWTIQHVDCIVYELYLTNENNSRWTTIVDLDEFDEFYVDLIKFERKEKLNKIYANNRG